MNLIGYIRVSTEEQGESGLGFEAQMQAVEAYVAARGHKIAWWESDIQSGSVWDRPGLQCALLALTEGWPCGNREGWDESGLEEVDGLIVAKLDRLARSVIHTGQIMEQLKAADKAFLALDLGVDTSTAAGRLIANVLAAVAEWERDVIRERTKAALAAKAARGEQVGRAPEIPAASEDCILRMRDHGLTFAKIAQLLNDENFETARGGRWSTSTVVRVCERARKRRNDHNTEGSNDGSDSPASVA